MRKRWSMLPLSESQISFLKSKPTACFGYNESCASKLVSKSVKWFKHSAQMWQMTERLSGMLQRNAQIPRNNNKPFSSLNKEVVEQSVKQRSTCCWKLAWSTVPDWRISSKWSKLQSSRSSEYAWSAFLEWPTDSRWSRTFCWLPSTRSTEWEWWWKLCWSAQLDWWNRSENVDSLWSTCLTWTWLLLPCGSWSAVRRKPTGPTSAIAC